MEIIRTIAFVTAVPVVIASAVVAVVFLVATMYIEYGWWGVASLPILVCWGITFVDCLSRAGNMWKD